MGAVSKVEDQATAAWAQEGLERANASGLVKLAELLEAVRDDIFFELELFEGASVGRRREEVVERR